MKGRVVPEYVRDALAGVAQKLGFVGGLHAVEYDFRPGSDNRSVVSVFYRVVFREEPREATVLCKVPPPGADESVFALFEREAFVYGKLLPAFEQFQRSASASHQPQNGGTSDAKVKETAEDETFFAPRCYHAHCDVKKGEGIIILEDVRKRGFSNRHKFAPMDYDHARLAMVQLGRFHAISLALKQQQPELFEQYRYMGDVTRESGLLGMDGFNQTMQLAFESAMATLNPADGSKREKLTRLRDGFADELRSINDTSLSEPFCVVCHGDFAGENMMFSYNVESIDEETSRVIVKFALGGAKEWLNEYMVMLVSKQEYNQYAKILNAAKYEEFKNREKLKADEAERTSSKADRLELSQRGSPNERRSRDCDRKDRSVESYREDRERPTERSLSQHTDREREERYASPVGGSDQRRDGGSTTDSDDERNRHRRKHKKASSSYVRTSSGTKKKSHKYKQRRERREERDDSSYGRRDQRRQGSDSESDGKHHKKKTKKSKKPRSRSRSRR